MPFDQNPVRRPGRLVQRPRGPLAGARWRRAWADLLGATGAVPALALSDAPPALPDKPSIAVMPFANLSNDPDQEYFADGMMG